MTENGKITSEVIPDGAVRGVVVRIPNRKAGYAYANVSGTEVYIEARLARKLWLREGQVVYLELKNHELGLRAQEVYRTDETVSAEELTRLHKQLKQS